MLDTTSATLPNLFVIGAMKCGTTTLHECLSAHPDVYMSSVKEPAFFIDPSQETPEKSNRIGVWNDRQRYLDLFCHGSAHTYRGEATTDYTKAPRKTGCAERIREFNRDARILYIMRDPVERTLSHYLWNVRNERETRSFADAIELDSQYTDVSNYAMQLAPYFQAFGRDGVYCLTIERLSVSPIMEMESLFAWLGLPPVAPLECGVVKLNRRPEQITQVRSRLLDRVRFSGTWNRVGSFVPHSLRRVVRRANERNVQTRIDLLSSEFDMLKCRQRQETQQLEHLLNRQFNEWTTLNSDSRIPSV